MSSPGRVRTRRSSSGNGPSVTDSRGRSRGKVVSQSQRESSDLLKLPLVLKSEVCLTAIKLKNGQSVEGVSSKTPHYRTCDCVSAGSRSGSPGRLLTATYGRIPRPTMGSIAANSAAPGLTDKSLARGHRSQGCSRETSPSRSGAGEASAPAGPAAAPLDLC